MSISDIFMLVITWMHLLSAVAWVGGSIFYLLILRPSLIQESSESTNFMVKLASEFRGLVVTSVIVLLTTGVILGFDRLQEGLISTSYVVVLAFKISISMWMFLLAWFRRRKAAILNPYVEQNHAEVSNFGRITQTFSSDYFLVLLGIIVLFLSDLLKFLFEISLVS
jgi:uncharacterized membrane protein